MSEQDWQKALIAFGTMVATGLATWFGVAVRRSFRNAGRTELEIALADLARAMEEERLALATADPADDLAAHQNRKLATERVNKAKRLKALLDGAAGDE